MPHTAPDRWFPVPPAPPGARLRLICLPFAGGGAAIYRDWRRQLPDWVHLCPAALPGRERRIREPAIDRADVMVARLAEAVRAELGDGPPLAIFGHSMGAALAWDLAHALRDAGFGEPVHLILSGRRGPGQPAREFDLHHLPDAAFRRGLADLGGTPPEVLAHDDLMSLLLPMLRADFALIERWSPRADAPPLGCPLTTFAGSEDGTATPDAVAAWSPVTTGPVRHHVIPGGHFFLIERPALLLSLLAAALEG